jgi:histidyl-tRNA synthetase
VKSQLDGIGVAYLQDPNLVRGLDYYTRTAFEVVLDEAVGPMATLSGGGRYDGLYRLVGDVDVPAVGFGIGIERLLAALEHQHVPAAGQSRADVYVTVTEPALQEHCLAVATRLREQGHRTVFEFGAAKLSRQLSRAASSGAQLCVILGADEWARGEVRIKDLATRDEWDVALTDLESAVAAALDPTGPTRPSRR